VGLACNVFHVQNIFSNDTSGEAAMLDISSEWSYEGIGFYAEALQ
jgi:hypothetical protein